MGILDADRLEAADDEDPVAGLVNAGRVLQTADFGTVEEVLGDPRIPAPFAARLEAFVNARGDAGDSAAAPAIYDHVVDGIVSVAVDDGWFAMHLSWPSNTLHVPSVVVAHQVTWDVGALLHEAAHTRGQYHVDCASGLYDRSGQDLTWDGSMGEAAFLLMRLSERVESAMWRGLLEMERDAYLRGLCPDVVVPD